MARTQRHEFLDISAIALCAVIGGADHWTEVVEFGQARQQWFAGFLKLPNGIPSHDTFARVFRLINAYFSPSWTAFQADRGRDFSVIVDGMSN